MMRILFLLFSFVLIIFFSCKPKANESSIQNQNDPISQNDSIKTTTEYTLSNKTVKFLWREYKYNKELNDSFYSIIINQDYCKTITDPERAALGYVATFIGNECAWDGEYSNDRNNLKCVVLDALDLGYQCSDKHLGFLRKWFRNDPEILKELETSNCPTTPDGATVQETFDEIMITTKDDMISVIFKASGVNMRESDSWSWTETDFFELNKDNIKLIKRDKSKVIHENFDN